MPPKVGDLIDELRKAGFVDRGGKGSHRNFTHSNVGKPVTISGKVADDAKHYQIRAVRKAIQDSVT
jgi:predicted RNA binding protein YcfA (HicA-like mRNA interferase family)